MKTIIAVFALVLAFGVSSDALNTACMTSYLLCLQTFQNAEGDACSNAKTTAQCFIISSTACGDGLEDTFKSYKALIDEECKPGTTFPADLKRIGECITKEIETFKTCTFNINPSNVTELCGFVENYLTCFSVKAKDKCSPSESLDKVLNPFIEFTKKCPGATGTAFSDCTKSIIKCTLDTFSYDLNCTDLEKLGSCILQTTTCGPEFDLMKPLLQRQLKQIPDYCNKDSPFRKNFDNSYQCVLIKIGGLSPCLQEFSKRVVELIPTLKDDNESIMKTVGVEQQLRSCIFKAVGTPCGTEGEFVVNYLLQPMDDLMDEACLKATQKKCGGASGLMAGTWLLLLSVAFLVTRYHV